MTQTQHASLAMYLAAVRHLGEAEIVGDKHNPFILECFRRAGGTWIKDDESHWCSAFLCHAAHEAGVMNPRTVRAANWAKWGEAVTTPQLGDVVVMKNHVTLWTCEIGANFVGLGGNQSNQVRHTLYPRNRILAIRRGQLLD